MSKDIETEACSGSVEKSAFARGKEVENILPNRLGSDHAVIRMMDYF